MSADNGVIDLPIALAQACDDEAFLMELLEDILKEEEKYVGQMEQGLKDKVYSVSEARICTSHRLHPNLVLSPLK